MNVTYLDSQLVLDGSNENGCQSMCAAWSGTLSCNAYNFNTGASLVQDCC